jgi:hypothetical protein
MSNSCAASDDQRWRLRVACRKVDAALPIEQNIITKDDVAVAAHPVDVHIRMKVAAVSTARRLEEWLRNEGAEKPIVRRSPNAKTGQQHPSDPNRDREAGESQPANPSSQASQPVFRNRKKLV